MYGRVFSGPWFLHCDILKALDGFKDKAVHKAKDMQFFFQNDQNVILKILRMFKNNMKFTISACWINSEISNRYKSFKLMILLYCLYCWPLLWCNYWRSLMMWNSTSWSRLNLPVQIQIALHPCDLFLINNRNMTSNSVKQKCFVMLNVKL